MTIKELCGSAYQNAIENVATVIYFNTGLALTFKDDFIDLETIADGLKIRFDMNGDIV